MVKEGADGILTQSEINALLSAVNEGQVDTEGPEEELPEEYSDILHYDLTSQDRIIRGRMPTLEIINDRFCRNFRITLSNALRKMIHVTMESTNLMKFGEFLNYLPIPSCLNIVRLTPLRGSSVVALEAKLLLDFLDIFFGGAQAGLPSKLGERDFTTIELMVVRRIIGLFLEDLLQAWRPVLVLQAEYVRTEINPQFVGIVGPAEVVVQTTFEVETETGRGTIHLVIPYASIEPFKDRLSSGFQSESLESDAAWSKRFMEKLYGVEVDVQADLGRTEIELGRLLTLEVGDVLSLDTSPHEPLEVEVQGKPKLLGVPVISGGNLAIQVATMIEPEWDKKEKSDVQ